MRDGHRTAALAQQDGEGDEEAVRLVRVILAALCGLIAVGLGGLSVIWIASELAWGRPHGPSPLLMGVLTLPIAILSGWVARRLYGVARPGS